MGYADRTGLLKRELDKGHSFAQIAHKYPDLWSCAEHAAGEWARGWHEAHN